MTDERPVFEGITQLFTLRDGDEIKVGGKWLEIHRIQASPTYMVFDLYDEDENRIRQFVAHPYMERRVRQTIQEAA